MTKEKKKQNKKKKKLSQKDSVWLTIKRFLLKDDGNTESGYTKNVQNKQTKEFLLSKLRKNK